MPRVLIHVQHLLGTGHVRRAAAIGAALGAAGFAVEIASGGSPVADLELGTATLTQLSPLRAADASFKTLLDAAGRPLDERGKAARRDQLLARFTAFRPDILVTELFPFGRRAIEFELLPLLDAARAARPRPLIVASVRDILVAPADPRKAETALARARDWYDRILVHGDPDVVDLPASYPAARSLTNLIYTGYIDSSSFAETSGADGTDEIIVSAGGGRVGARLIEAALGAYRAGAATQKRWRLLLGADLPDEVRARVAAAVGDRLAVEPARPDFPALLRRCHISISQAGYNTAMDVAQANARAVFVPIAVGGETEQALRAQLFAARGWAVCLPERDLSVDTLSAAIARAAAMPRPDFTALKRDGAAQTARILSS